MSSRLVNIDFLSKEYEKDREYTIEDEIEELKRAIGLTQSCMRPWHCEYAMYSRSIDRYKKRIEELQKQLEEKKIENS